MLTYLERFTRRLLIEARISVSARIRFSYPAKESPERGRRNGGRRKGNPRRTRTGRTNMRLCRILRLWGRRKNRGNGPRLPRA